MSDLKNQNFFRVNSRGVAANIGLDCYEAKHRHKILIVDDDESIILSLKRCIGNSYHVDYFTSPLAALNSAKHTAYDLVISDQRMPSMDGIELLSKIKHLQPHCIPIILSGLQDPKILLKAINQAHIYHYLCKPWVNIELLNLIEEALDFGCKQAENLRLADKARVNSGSMTKHRAYLRDLESKYPGITNVERDENGAIVLHDRH